MHPRMAFEVKTAERRVAEKEEAESSAATKAKEMKTSAEIEKACSFDMLSWFSMFSLFGQAVEAETKVKETKRKASKALMREIEASEELSKED